MVVFIALNIFTFNGCSASTFLTGKAFVLKSFLVNIFDSFDADHSILLLEITFRNPNSTNIMDPNIMASRN